VSPCNDESCEIIEVFVIGSCPSRNHGRYRLRGLLHTERCVVLPCESIPIFVDTCYIRRNGDRKYMVNVLHHTPKPVPIIYRAIFHDPTVYPEPNVFKPERFLNPDGSSREDPVLVSAFGFGRRICPGRHFVDATLFITVASLFSVFNIQKGQGAEGEPFTYSYTGSIIRYDYTLLRRAVILSYL
jgi:Cytochrome P450